MQRSILVTTTLLCSLAGGLISSAVAAESAPAAAAVAAPAAAAKAGVDMAKMVETQRANLVTLKFILKSEGGEQEMEATGVMIEGEGLVLVSNFSMGGSPFGPAPQPTELKILVGDDTQGVEATVIARDTELGLAWAKVSKAPEKPYAFLDIAKGADVKLGDALTGVSLMGKFFDRAPTIYTSNVAAVVSKPRKLGIPGEGFPRGELGLPVFNAEGAFVGFTTFVLPDREEMSDPFVMKGIRSCMLLPADEVVTATKRAKETAATAKEGETPDLSPPKAVPEGGMDGGTGEAPKEEPKAEAPKEEAKPAEPKKPE